MQFFKSLLCGAALLSTAVSASASTFVGDRTDFRDETIYFAMTTRFYDGDPTNNVLSWDKQDVQISKNDPDWRGDFKGLIDKLDYIKALGFTAIWMTPVVQNASGEDYHGYHSMDFSSVDLRYESRKEWGAAEDVKFQDLIDAAHAKGLKIVLDVVLQHTGNFGEVNLNPLFTRDQNIRNQATPAGSLIPNPALFGANYFDQTGEAQYAERWKYFKNPEYEKNNYYHHYGTGWNWDLPNRWWGQIAGDCVDLNTENDYVAQYIIDCYGKFIEMGVDAFRIDTTGHISPLTFNTQFVPQLMALGEKYKDKRLNGCPFYMYGECCQRYQGTVVYRGQPNLSSYFYTWKSDPALVSEFKTMSDADWWRGQTLAEGHDTPVGPMAVCEKDTEDKPRSDNAWLVDGAWHEPDYSEASGLNVIDFPMHYSFSSAASAISYAGQDNYYNDATYNVVYVDSHDYCPGPSDGTRFNGGTAQWAENLSLMFTFRGIPCLYYGSEVEFKAGKPIDVGGTNNKTPRSESGRAYYGAYLEGTVTATDFGCYEATGNVAKTLDGDLAQHIRRLNMIRAAVPALRKGQYTFDGCSASGGWAFKRAYKNESYALVSINGGATFSNVPAGTYTDVVTGQQYTANGGSITVSAPTNQGQLRVLVKDWTGGKIGEDGKFMYTTSAVAHGGNPEFDDPGASQYYTADDVVGRPAVKFDPASGAFNTETQTVTATLNEAAVSGWIQVPGKDRVSVTAGTPAQFTIGQDMSYGESVTVNWGASGSDGVAYTGSATYRKVDPNATITVYIKSESAPNLYAWGENSGGESVEPCGTWPGKKLSDTRVVDGIEFYYFTFDDMETVNVIINNGSDKTDDIKGITEDVYYEYNGTTGYTKLDVNPVVEPSVSFSPKGGDFYNEVSVTATARNASSAWYQIGDGDRVTFSGSTSFTLGADMDIDESVTVSWGATDGTATKTGAVTYTKCAEPEGIRIYYDNSVTKWSTVKIHHWSVEETTWPGNNMELYAQLPDMFTYVLPVGTTGVVINNGNGEQTVDITNPENNRVYKGTVKTDKWQIEKGETIAGVEDITAADSEQPVEWYNLQGMRVAEPTTGIYIRRQGNQVTKIRIM